MKHNFKVAGLNPLRKPNIMKTQPIKHSCAAVGRTPAVGFRCGIFLSLVLAALSVAPAQAQCPPSL
ncbi:exported hypothetical protein [Verrucomicrobia bacterium]|nr:exported hypothetical protein [Verrucomicrobiota bacterium]